MRQLRDSDSAKMFNRALPFGLFVSTAEIVLAKRSNILD